MSYQQLHAGKVKLNGLAGIHHHLLDRQRVKTNPDIELSRSNFNHSIEDLSPDNLIRNVRQRIKQLHLKRKPRIDAVGLEDIIIGASSDYILHQLTKLETETATYTAVPTFWRKHIDSSIAQLQESFTRYCHDINRATIRVFIATHGDFDKTSKIMLNSLQKAGVTDIQKHISNVLKSAKEQLKKTCPRFFFERDFVESA